MNPRDFFTLAMTLARSDSPAEMRTAVSRAYYASFHVSAEILRDMGCIIHTNHQGHYGVINCLGASPNIEIKKLGSKLGDLHSKRRKADYDMAENWIESADNVQGVMQNATEILRNLERLCNGTDRDAIKQAMLEYQRENRVNLG